MTLKLKSIFLVLGTLLASAASAKAPTKELQEIVDQLQKNPSDTALREKMFKLIKKKKPALPDAAIEAEGRGQYAFKSAKSVDDFQVAAKEYEKAIVIAPWVFGYYSDLCTIYEKAGKLEDAKRNCEFGMIGLTNTAQLTDLKRRIAGLKFAMEQRDSPAAIAKRASDSAEEQQRKFLASLEGGVWNAPIQHFQQNPPFSSKLSIQVRNGRLIRETRTWVDSRGEPAPTETDNVALTGRQITVNQNPKFYDTQNVPQITLQISDDGQTITQSYTLGGNPWTILFSREK